MTGEVTEIPASPAIPPEDHPHPRLSLFLILCSLFFYTLTHYGGITSPDSEVVLRTAGTLADNHTFAVHNLGVWKGFGIARGTDGQYYSIFGPMESVLLAPFVKAGEWFNQTRWYESWPLYLPVSFYVGSGLHDFVLKVKPADTASHALRFLLSFFNIAVSCIGVYLFWLVMRRLTGSDMVSFFVSVVYALGTMTWNYAGTMFSEPLATMFALLSFYFLLGPPGHAAGLPSGSRLALSGCMLGCSVATHITAILFVPFFAAYPFLRGKRLGSGLWKSIRISLPWAAGLGAMLILLGVYNYARFGNMFETGRSVDPEAMKSFGYGSFTTPWEGLVGLTVSWGKGLLWYSPAVLLGFLGLRDFYRNHRDLCILLLGAVLFRLLFLSMRTDWHGGYCLGPRYLLPIIPFTLIPFGFWLKRKIISRSWNMIYCASALSALFIALQLYFNIGEVISFYFIHVWNPVTRLQSYVQLFFDPEYSPFLHILSGLRGPFLLMNLPESNLTLWLLGVILIGALTTLGVMLLRLELKKVFPAPENHGSIRQ